MNNNQITNILTILLIIMSVILFLLLMVAIFMKLKDIQKKQKLKETLKGDNDSIEDKSTVEQNYDKQSIFNFMKFDKVEDNMIIQNRGMRYLMVVGCQGVNYDLMSRNEKIAVEQGFIQFLNTLRNPIQIYIQTRTINLGKSISTYQSRVKEYEDKLNRMRMEYKRMVESGRYTKEELNKYLFEVTKQTNLYEYGKDIIKNTEQMSLNRRVLSKKYYIVVPYHSSDLGNDNLDKEEIQNMSFSELYTMAQSIVRTLAVCGIKGKILNSDELTELLYVAYNRDEEETYSLEKAKRAGFEELYSTGKDILDKKMEALDEKIEKEAIALANLKVAEAKSDKERKVEEKEDNLDTLISELAKSIVANNKQYIGEDIADSAVKKIEEEEKTTKKKKGGEKDDEEKPKTKSRARKTK